jgi:voltage-gated potassium channel
VIEVVLAVYSVVVFASLAGMLGAFFLERRPPSGHRPEPEAVR